MKAIWNNQVIAEAQQAELVRIEGNFYFPPTSLNKQFYTASDHHTTCHWKGEASYYDVTVDGKKNDFGAWYYPQPKDGALERVKHDFSNYVAFWNGIEVVE